MNARVRRLVHRFVAPPLQIVVPRLGDRLYDRTAPYAQHPSITGVRFGAMFERDPSGGWRVRNAISTERLTGLIPGDRAPARASASTPGFHHFDGEGVRRSVARSRSLR